MKHAATVAAPAALEPATLVTATGGAHGHPHYRGPAYSPPFVPYGYAMPAGPWAYAPPPAAYAAYSPMAWGGGWWPGYRR